MSVSFIIGKPGCGKSLVTLQDYILSALLSGRCVYHNIPGLEVVKIAYYLSRKHKRKDITPYYVESLLHDYSNEHLLSDEKVWKDWYFGDGVPTEMDAGPYYLKSIPDAPTGSLIVLDEAQKKCYINSKDWATEKNKKFFEYCSIHRKKKHEVLIITQDDSNVDASVVGIREELIFMLRQERLGFLFRNCVSLRFYLGHENIAKTPYAKVMRKYDSAMYGLYESYSVTEGKKEVRRVRVVFFDTKTIIVMVVGVALLAKSYPFFKSMMSGRVLTDPKNTAQSKPFDPSSFLGAFEDYHCSDRIYVLRSTGAVDTIPPRYAPAALCPRFDYVHSENFKPKEAE